jgi:titin
MSKGRIIFFRFYLFFLFFCLEVTSVHASSYYISSRNGNDNNAGTSAGTPWKSLDKLNQVLSTLRAGDIIYFEKGSEWENVKLNLANLTGTSANPILFSTYGTGAKPLLKGSKTISSFSLDGNIWRKTDTSLPDYIATTRRVIPFVYINNNRYEVSRYPDKGTLTTYTHTGTASLEAQQESWAPNHWKNGLVCVRAVNWIWDSRRINNNSSDVLYFDNLANSYEKDSSPYLIRNHVNACNLQGEWAQQNDTLWINYNGNINQQHVEVPIVDTMIRITNCDHIQFDGISFERAVIFVLHASESKVTIKNCNISDAGGGLVLANDFSTLNVTGSTLSYGRRGGIYLERSHGHISNNTFRHLAFEGADNTQRTFGASVGNWYCNDISTITQNSFDSVNIAYHGHLSYAESYITKNVISHYGMTIRDCAAVYFGTDYTEFKKHVNHNIISNAVNNFSHAIYIDYNTRNVIADSNSISGSNLAIYVHVSMNNSIKYNNIIVPSRTMTYPWNSAIRFDEYIYNLGLREVTPIINNELLYNNIVLGTGTNEAAVMYFDVNNLSNNTINFNNYFDPYNDDAYILNTGEDYASYRSFSLAEWVLNTGQDRNSTFNRISWPYSSNPGVSREEFVLMLSNPTDREIMYDLRSHASVFMDVNGEQYSETIKIPAYYSVILFNHGKKQLPGGDNPTNDDIVIIVDDTSWKRSLKPQVIGSTSASISWDNFPVPIEYIVERRKAGSDIFTRLIKQSYTTRFYEDTGLLPATTYVYRVKAGTSVTDSLVLTTLNAEDLPLAPSDLTAEITPDRRVFLKWSDVNTNEKGFVIERIGPTEFVKATFRLNENSTSFNDQGVIANATYTYKIKAFNNNGSSVFTPPVQLYTAFVDDSFWRNNVMLTTIASDKVDLAWTNYPVETIYRVERRNVNDGKFTEIAQLQYRTNRFSDGSVTPSTSYVYRVRTAIGISNELAVSTLADSAPLTIPAFLQVMVMDLTTALLNWTDYSNNESGFILERYGPDDLTTKRSFVFGPNSTTFTDSELKSGSIYKYRICSYNTENQSPFSQFVEVLTPSEGLVNLPSVPEGLNGKLVDASVILLSWNDRSDNEYGFILEKSLPDTMIFRESIALGQNVNMFRDTAWIKNSTFYYRLRAYNNFGFSGYTPPVKVSTGSSTLTNNNDLPPLAPAELKATLFETTGIRLSWLDMSVNEYGFIIERTGPNDPTLIKRFMTDQNTSGYTDTALLSGSAYRYRIMAYNSYGFSPDVPWVEISTTNLKIKTTETETSNIPLPSDKSFMTDNAYELTVYPNPAVDQLFIQIQSDQQTLVPIDAVIRITDLYGRIKNEIAMKTGAGLTEITEIDVSDLTKGIYFIQVTTGGQVLSRKFIIW